MIGLRQPLSPCARGLWLRFDPFARGLPGQETHDIRQRGRGRADGFPGVGANTGHLHAEMGIPAVASEMAQSNLFLTAPTARSDVLDSACQRIR